MNRLRAFIRFSRPHTVIGTTLSICGLYAIAVAHVNPEQFYLDKLIWALLSCLGANIYIVGLNQLTDVQIDRVNKPNLPLASGEFSMRAGSIINSVALILSIGIAAWQGRFLFITVMVSLLIGTIYSLPPFRLKRFHFWAAACIFTIRGLVVNIFIFLHFNRIFLNAVDFPPQMWALTVFIFGLSLVIAWFKDIPDAEGDRRFKIMTLTVHLGAEKVFKLGRGLLTVCYLGLIIAGLAGLPRVNQTFLVATHIILLIVMWLLSRRVDPAQQASMARYYLTIWILFFAEYLIFPTACLLN
ncbi:MAG: homogentisate phytyltransferase [Aliifodinibius sp.]|nr:homogentisate phytyltransferase [Fodinibius sp.]